MWVSRSGDGFTIRRDLPRWEDAWWTAGQTLVVNGGLTLSGNF